MCNIVTSKLDYLHCCYPQISPLFVPHKKFSKCSHTMVESKNMDLSSSFPLDFSLIGVATVNHLEVRFKNGIFDLANVLHHFMIFHSKYNINYTFGVPELNWSTYLLFISTVSRDKIK